MSFARKANDTSRLHLGSRARWLNCTGRSLIHWRGYVDFVCPQRGQQCSKCNKHQQTTCLHVLQSAKSLFKLTRPELYLPICCETLKTKHNWKWITNPVNRSLLNYFSFNCASLTSKRRPCLEDWLTLWCAHIDWWKRAAARKLGAIDIIDKVLTLV